ncbi:MAG: PilZ domain-containing protein [Elusimicrobia bacterium]|nr:PilZ domain-containing protein [Elusimicrobiota bacterium]
MSHTTHKHEKVGTERRAHVRLPVVEGMIEPITVQFGPGEGQSAPAAALGQPAILTNLSAGGMSLLMFLEPPHARRLDMVLSIPGLDRVPIAGRVVRVHQRGPTYNVGISFTQISKKHQDQISKMAEDHGDCETRVALKLPEVCVKPCTFHALCAKPQKMPFWPKK